jgi:hypothetical protein
MEVKTIGDRSPESRQSWSLDNAVKAEDVQDIFKLADWSGTRSSDIRSPSP